MLKVFLVTFLLSLGLPSGESCSFVPEDEMMTDLLAAVARFSEYIVKDFIPCETQNAIGETCGFFTGDHPERSSAEPGVRTNADFSMLCAFLVKYAKPRSVELPEGVSYEMLEDMARKSLVYAYSTHRAVRLHKCEDGQFWGSTGLRHHVWESSLWAFSVAWSAFFQWDKLDASQKKWIYNLLKAECGYELLRKVPNGYIGDSKAEENGWETCVLAATLGLFPDDPLAPFWFRKMRRFAVNGYSHPSDQALTDPLDAWFNKTSAADLYVGQNLFEDYTLQNHKFFHTSYQNIVIQELGEAALALEMFQAGLGRPLKWKSKALMHNLRPVMDKVLAWLALPDGELAMPNGNDWSLFLFDQITSYSTLAALLRDSDALMLENRAYKGIVARQATTDDGSWLLRADIGARRMGVQGHRVMMTYLLHETRSTADLKPSSWEDFRQNHAAAYVFPCQKVVRAFTASRFAVFSYSEGLKNYAGYTESANPLRCKITVPLRRGGGGNFTGWFEVEGKQCDATASVPFFSLDGHSFVTGCTLLTNESSLENKFAVYATPGNAVLYVDAIKALRDGIITAERGLVAGISVDAFTSCSRRVVSSDGSAMVTDGESMDVIDGTWMNIDSAVGIVARGTGKMSFGECFDNHSIMTAVASGSFSDVRRPFTKGDQVTARTAAFYTDVTPEQLAALDSKMIVLEGGDCLPQGWRGCIAFDPDGTVHRLVSHFEGKEVKGPLVFEVSASRYPGVPVFSDALIRRIAGDWYCSESLVDVSEGQAVGHSTRFFLLGDGIRAWADGEVLHLRPEKEGRTACVGYALEDGSLLRLKVELADGHETLVRFRRGELEVDGQVH